MWNERLAVEVPDSRIQQSAEDNITIVVQSLIWGKGEGVTGAAKTNCILSPLNKNCLAQNTQNMTKKPV